MIRPPARRVELNGDTRDLIREDIFEQRYMQADDGWSGYDIPYGTPDSWIPDNPNEDGFTMADFL